MLVGHVAAGMVGKRAAPQVSLGTLVLAAFLCDLLWGAFLLTGLEQIIIKPGRGAAHYLDAVDFSLSHGLATTVLWAALFAGVWFLRRRDTRAALVLFALVVSHWLLDFISHGPDMALAPGVHARVGLGLWNSIPATIVVEGGFWLIAVILYTRATQPRTRLTAFVHRPAHAGLVQQHRRPSAGQSTRRSDRKPDLLFCHRGVGLLDERVARNPLKRAFHSDPVRWL